MKIDLQNVQDENSKGDTVMDHKKEPTNTVPMDLLTEPLYTLCQRAIALINRARTVAVRQVNMVQLLTYYTLGEWIVEVQQEGAGRAKYGKRCWKRYLMS